jgi:hypothetical protein
MYWLFWSLRKSFAIPSLEFDRSARTAYLNFIILLNVRVLSMDGFEFDNKSTWLHGGLAQGSFQEKKRFFYGSVSASIAKTYLSAVVL